MTTDIARLRELAERLRGLAQAPTIAPPSVYANACGEAQKAIDSSLTELETARAERDEANKRRTEAHTAYDKEFRRAETARAQVEGMRTTLGAAIGALDDLIANSRGVDGLHLNGDVAPWTELQAGGRCEEWLLPLEHARAVLAPKEPT